MPNLLKAAQVEKIGDSAFTGCKSLDSIFIPKTVLAIGNGVFTGCNNLSDIQISKDNRIFSEKNNCIINNDTKTLIYAINKDFSIPDRKSTRLNSSHPK